MCTHVTKHAENISSIGTFFVWREHTEWPAVLCGCPDSSKVSVNWLLSPCGCYRKSCMSGVDWHLVQPLLHLKQLQRSGDSSWKGGER